MVTARRGTFEALTHAHYVAFQSAERSRLRDQGSGISSQVLLSLKCKLGSICDTTTRLKCLCVNWIFERNPTFWNVSSSSSLSLPVSHHLRPDPPTHTTHTHTKHTQDHKVAIQVPPAHNLERHMTVEAEYK